MVLEKITRLCKERGISLSALEKKTGIGNGTIAKWEGRYPRVDSLKKVADFFGVSIDELLKGDSD